MEKQALVSKKKELALLVDGSSYLYRAFHALPPLTTNRGEPSGAIYGVLNMLKKLVKEEKPHLLAVVFDTPMPTFRHTLYPEYKAHRLQMPEALQQQIEPLHAMILAMGFPLIALSGVEADDVIGTLARQAVENNISVLISTGDKDFAQLVNDEVQLINTMTGGRLDPKGVLTRYGISAEQIIDYLALVGDHSDNIPGIPKVGPKTAVKWLTQYGNLNQLVAHASELSGKVGESLRSNLHQLNLAKQLLTIQKTVELKHHILDLQPTVGDPAELRRWFERFEFNTWLKELGSTKIQPIQPLNLQYQLILTQADFEAWRQKLVEAPLFAVDVETTSLDTLEAELVGIAFSISTGQSAYIPVAHAYPGAPQQLSRDWVLSELKPLLESSDKKKIGHNLKYELGVFENYGIELRGLYSDTLLESYLLNGGHRRHDLDTLALQHLGHTTVSFESIAGTGKHQKRFDHIELTQAAPYAAEDATVCLALHQVFEPQLKEIQGLKLKDEIEMPLVGILSHMERQGVLIDAAQLNEQNRVLTQRLAHLEAQSYQVAGQEFNLNSPQQLRTILYQQYGLPIVSKTATGQASTSERVLETLADQHPLAKLILEYRQLNKLKSTYTEALPKQIHPKTGRIHTSYHQAVVTTGRLSSSNPNLQNIPIRTDEGRKIRRAFIAPTDYNILAADYSQIELRIMAHLSKDEGLISAFLQEKDVHTATAAELFGVALEEVNAEQRRRAKAVNFGLMYGMSPFGLAAQLRIAPNVAREIVERYFNRYPGVKQYMERTRIYAREQGYVTTLHGRRLLLPHIRTGNKLQQKASERAAINAPLQGTAADIIKKAMIRVEAALRHEALEAQMIMQVHDELVFEVKKDQIQVAKACIEMNMQQAAQLCVPLSVTVGVGCNWDEAH